MTRYWQEKETKEEKGSGAEAESQSQLVAKEDNKGKLLKTSKGGRVIIPLVSQEGQLGSNVSILLFSAACLIFCISIFGIDKPEFTSVGV